MGGAVTAAEKTSPSLLEALFPIALLVSLLGASVAVYGEDSSYGPNQIALLLAALVAGLLGLRHGHGWPALEAAVVRAISVTMPACLILLAVGALIGAWILSGTVPYLILLAAELLSPSWYYAACCLICALISLSIGSSWTTAGTVGIALMGAAEALGLSPMITAGAIISGAYFGDKMSPLSETTNLAAAVAEADLFAHIRNMLWTALPALAIALLLFSWLSAAPEGASADVFAQLATALESEYDLGPLSLLPLLLLLALSVLRFPPVPVIAAGTLLALALALLTQYPAALSQAPAGLEGLPAALAGCWTVLYAGFESQSSVESVASLLTRGGMGSMLNTVWLILCAMVFAGVMEATGALARLVSAILSLVRGVASLQVSTLVTALVTNILAADQYMGVSIPGRLFQGAYARRRVHRLNLSRNLEDGGTLTSVLVPWNTCGAYMAATLGVGTLAYLPFCFFNMASFSVAVLWAFLGIGLVAPEAEAEPAP
jgi:NhaC family Na+:H+ antiporter